MSCGWRRSARPIRRCRRTRAPGAPRPARGPCSPRPGERWRYNTGAQVLGVLVARAAGQPFSEVLKTRVFDPLGMSDTGFWTTETHRLATAYMPAPHGLVVTDEPGGKWSHPPAFG